MDLEEQAKSFIGEEDQQVETEVEPIEEPSQVDETVQDQEDIATEEVPETDELDKSEEPEVAGNKPTMVPVGTMIEERNKERDKRKAAEAELEQLKAKLEEPKEEPKAGNLDPSDPNPRANITDEDFDLLMPNEQHKLTMECVQWQQRENQRLTDIKAQQELEQRRQAQERRGLELEQQALATYTTAKMGEGFDWETVTKTGQNWLNQQDHKDIANSSDPAKTFYDLCIERCPPLRKAKASTNEPIDKQENVPKIVPDLEDEFKDDSPLGQLASSLVR